MREKFVAFLDGHAADMRNVLVVDKNVARLFPQPRAIAFRTNRVSAIPAQEDANVQLVYLRFGVFISNSALLAFEGFTKSKLLFAWSRAISIWGRRPIEDLENDLTVVFAKADLDGIDQSLTNIRRDFEAVHEHIGSFREIH